MRAVLLLLLGGGLVWFIWHSFDAAPAAEAASSPGAMLPPETAPKTPERALPVKAPEPLLPKPVAPSTAQGIPPAPRDTTPTAPAPSPAAPPTREKVITDRAEPSSGVTSSALARNVEIDLARGLLTDPEKFAARIEGLTDVAPPRRDYLRALSLALFGSRSEARSRVAQSSADASIGSRERDFLRRIVATDEPFHELPAIVPEAPVVTAASQFLAAREAARLRDLGKHHDAARVYSALLLSALDSGWNVAPETLRAWSAALKNEQRLVRWNRGGDWKSVDVRVLPQDSLITVRKRVVESRPDLLVCIGQIARANELSGTTIHPGQTLRVPADRARMLVDLDAHWALYMLGDEVVSAFEVAVGKIGTETKPGEYSVGETRHDPMWFPPGKSPVPFGDPANPLGTRWIAWLGPDGATCGLGFHGTNDPDSIGKDQSQGCIRMRNSDVEELAEVLPRGARILVQP